MGALMMIILWGIPIILIGPFVVGLFDNPLRSLGWLVLDLAERKRRADRAAAELDRKTAIADAAIAARRRGEAVTPPADYHR